VKILIQDQQGVRALEEGFASEQELQTFLRQYPDLMPLEEIDLDAPPLLCIGREVGLASGAEDILYIDENGLLTVVETKLRKNPEARREVVGQILEYAAQMSTWSASDVERQAEKFFGGREAPEQYGNCTLERAMQVFLQPGGGGGEFSYDDFIQQVGSNIERGHFRLIIAIDEPPEPLLKTVEFVNRFSERFEIYLIQLKRFRDLVKEQNIFVPALFGRVAVPRTRRAPGRPWDKEGFLRQASGKSPKSVEVLERIIEFAEAENAIVWGRGANIGTFRFGFNGPEGKRIEAFYVAANGTMEIGFASLIRDLDQDAVKAYREALSRTAISPEAIVTDTWKDFDVSALNSEQSWDAFVTAVLALRASVQATHD